jgi:hypothetical protein
VKKRSLGLGKYQTIKTCDNCISLGVRIGKDGRDEKEIREGIGEGREGIKRLNGIWWHKEMCKERLCNIYIKSKEYCIMRLGSMEVDGNR